MIASLQMRCFIVAPLTVLAGALFGQTRTGEPLKTSLCELVREPERFNGKIVEIRAEFVARFQWAGFVDENCSAKIQVGAYHVLDDLKPQQGEYAFTTVHDVYNLSRMWLRIALCNLVSVGEVTCSQMTAFQTSPG